MQPPFDAWEQFLNTGKVSDYLRYCQSLETAPKENETVEGEDYPNANEHPSSGNWHTGY